MEKRLIKASFKDGLLSIDIPKVEPTKPKKTISKDWLTINTIS